MPVPKHFMSATKAEKEKLGHGVGYQYAHDNPAGYVDQEYLGVDKTYYTPTQRGYEQRIAEYLNWIKQQREAGR